MMYFNTDQTRIDAKAFGRIAVLFIMLVGFAVYANTLEGQFVFDDIPHILQNRHIRVGQIDFETVLNAAFKSPLATRPVANLSFALNYYLGGVAVFGFHLFNIIIHIINAIFVFGLVRKILREAAISYTYKQGRFQIETYPYWEESAPDYGALLAACLFVAHPIQIQSVAYTVQRMNSLAVMFYFCAFYCYLYARNVSSQKKWIWFGAALAAWLFSLGSKEIAITLPFAIGLYEWFFIQKLNRKWLTKSGPYFLGLIAIVLAIVFVFLRGAPLEYIINGYAERDFTMGQRVLTQLRVFIFYLSLVFFPHPSRLNLEHAFSTSKSLLDPATTLAAFIFLILYLGTAAWLARRHRMVSFCLLWFFLHLIVESSVISLEMVFEHRLYLPMFAFALLGGYILYRVLPLKPGYILVVAGVVILLLGTASHIRNRVWNDSVTLWTDVITKNPQSARAHYNLGSELIRRGSLKLAAHHLARAISLKPDDKQAHINLGIILSRLGDDKAALAHYRKALAIDPRFAIAYNNIGFLHEKNNRLELALANYQTALEIQPDFVEARNNLGNVLRKLNRTEEAVFHYLKSLQVKTGNVVAGRKQSLALTQKWPKKDIIGRYLDALEWSPKSPLLYNDLGVLLMEENIVEAALFCFNKAVILDPGNANAHNNLGVALAKRGFHSKAARHYRKALRLKPDYAEAHNNLGIALTRQKHYQKAVYHFEQALRLDPKNPRTRKNLAIARRELETRN